MHKCDDKGRINALRFRLRMERKDLFFLIPIDWRKFQAVLNSEPAHANLPKRAPMPAVTAIASAPQNVTRHAPFVTLAPPARAANPPRYARNSRDTPATKGTRLVAGTMTTVRSGMAAPTANVLADVSAA